MSKETMTQALEALEAITVDVKSTPTAYEAQRQAINALREALAEQPAPAAPVQQEPVGYVEFEGDDVIWTGDPPESGTLLYAAPQAQPAPEIAIADAYRAGVDSGIAAEREACAEMCSDIDGGENMFSRAIRARGNT